MQKIDQLLTNGIPLTLSLHHTHFSVKVIKVRVIILSLYESCSTKSNKQKEKFFVVVAILKGKGIRYQINFFYPLWSKDKKRSTRTTETKLKKHT